MLENYGIGTRAYIIELNVDDLFAAANFDITYKPIPKFAAVNRDLALICDKYTPVGDLKKIIEKSAGSLLENVTIFDVYEGEQIPKDKKSVAINVSLQSETATLTEEQINSAIKKIIRALEAQNITLRS